MCPVIQFAWRICWQLRVGVPLVAWSVAVYLLLLISVSKSYLNTVLYDNTII
jgi:hypothetical protein